MGRVSNENENNFQKYLKIGSWILTIIFVIFMFTSSLSSDEMSEIIESSKTEEGREQYLEEKYGNMANELQ